MVDLRLVPPAEPDPAEKVRMRVRKMVRPDGMLQCNRCGSRAVITIIAGQYIQNGRKTGGTVIEKDICGNCWKGGIITSMLPPLEPVKPA